MNGLADSERPGESSNGTYWPSASPTVFAITFSPRPEYAPLVRQFVLDFYGYTAVDPELVSQVSVAAHEFLENAVKYAAQGESGLRIEVMHKEPIAQVVLRTWNTAPRERIQELERAFQEMESEPDPMQFYLTRMRKTARQAEGSGLGFARIRAECGMELNLRVQGEHIEITAKAAFPVEVRR